MKAAAGIATGSDWQEALDQALTQVLDDLQSSSVDLAMLFASADYAPHYTELVAEAKRRLRAGALIGCSGQGVIGKDREVETEPAISVLAFSLPDAQVHPIHVTQSDIADGEALQRWSTDLRSSAQGANGFVVLADPFSLDPEALLSALGLFYPDAPLIGGLASGDVRRQETHLFMDGAVLEDGAIVVAIRDPYTIKTVVAQGAEPIGQAWTITGATENVVETLGMRPAVEILLDTLGSLPPETQDRARRNLLVGLAMNEYRDEFHRGDFLIRNLVGANQEEGWIAIGARPTLGQTLQFQIRDPQAADADLAAMLSQAKDELGADVPIGALLCACNGRGVGLFGTPSHDAAMVGDLLGPLPLAGFFCNGEIGPVGGKAFLHGYTASLALIVRKPS